MRAKKQRKTLIITLAIILATVALPLGAGAVSKALPSLAIASQNETTEQPEPEIQTVSQDIPDIDCMAVCALSGDLLTADGLQDLILGIDTIPITVDGEEVSLSPVRNADGYPVCYLVEAEDEDGDVTTASVRLTSGTDLAEILADIDPDYYYFLGVVPDLSALGSTDGTATADNTDNTAPVLTRDIEMATIHMNAGMLVNNSGLESIVDDYEVAETVINGSTVYIPLVKDSEGNVLWDLNESEDGSPDTYIRTIGRVGADGNDTGWAEALAKIKDGYMYYLSAALDYDNAYTLDSEGKQTHFDIAY